MTYRTAFITGASSGIGYALALELAGHGIKVCVAARRKELLEGLVAEVAKRGGEARAYELDVVDPNAVESTLKRADDDFGGIDLVVANAGVGRECWSGKLSWDKCDNTIAVNVNGAVATLVALAPRMVNRKHGHLVGTSSLAQYRGLPRNAVYSASKAFLSTFLEGMRVDLRGTGVAVTDVRPGFVKTPMTDKNAHSMPFMVEADKAARIMWKGIESKDAVVAFPWQLASVVRTASVLPAALYDRAISRARGTS